MSLPVAPSISDLDMSKPPMLQAAEFGNERINRFDRTATPFGGLGSSDHRTRMENSADRFRSAAMLERPLDSPPITSVDLGERRLVLSTLAQIRPIETAETYSA
jgi:hypothetical protein